MDSLEEEKERGITIKSSGVSLFFHDWVCAAPPTDIDPSRSSVLYVSNLPWTIEGSASEYEAALKEFFAQFGKIDDVSLHAKRGFAHICFRHQESCDRAIAAAAQEVCYCCCH